MNRVVGVLSLAGLVFVAACSSSTPSAPTVNVPFSATDLTVGTGTTASTGTHAFVTYTLWLYSASAANNKGTQLESGPYDFVVGANQTIAGFDRGVNGMKVGGSRRIVVPPDLGYGNTARQGIPANSTLIFEITLTAVQ